MSVLVVGRSIRGYEGFMARAFAELGFDVVFLGYEDIRRSLYGASGGWLGGVLLRRLLVSRVSRERVIGGHTVLRLYNRLVARLAGLLEPELVFVVKGEALSAATIRGLVDAVPGERLAYFNPDDPRYGMLVNLYGEAGFRVFTACHPCLRVFGEAYGRSRVVLLPFAARPLARFRCGVRIPIAVFAGSVYPERLRVVRALLRQGLPLVLVGPGWRYFVPRSSPGVYGAAYLALARVAYAAVNIHHGEDAGVKANMRVFEVPGAGGVEATDNPRIVSWYFRPGKELFTYSDVDELVGLLRELLGWEPGELCRIAEAGYQRVVREHTYRHRALRVLEAAGLAPRPGRGRVVDAASLLGAPQLSGRG